MDRGPVAGWRRRKQEYRHRNGRCSRLLFVGFLAPGTHIEIRCPACGKMHIIDGDPIQELDKDLTAVL